MLLLPPFSIFRIKREIGSGLGVRGKFQRMSETVLSKSVPRRDTFSVSEER